MAVAIAGEAGHRRHEKPESDRPERYAVRTPRQPRARGGLAPHASGGTGTAVAARYRLPLRAAGDEHSAAAVALLVVGRAQASVPARIRERLGPVRDLDLGRLAAQVLDDARLILHDVQVALRAPRGVQICISDFAGLSLPHLR